MHKRRNSIDLGKIKTEHCETCDKERDFHLILNYRYFGFYWVFNVVTEKKYWLSCNVCNRGWELDAKHVETELINESPVPFMNRFGLLLIAGIFVVLFGFCIIVPLILS